MTILFLFFYLLFIKISQSKQSIKTYNESYIYSYLINDEISDLVPSFEIKIIKYHTDVLPVGIYLNPKTGYIFGRPQQACIMNVTVHGYTKKNVLKENIIIQVFKNTTLFSYSSEKNIYTTTNFKFYLSPITVSDCSNYQIVNIHNNRLKIDSWTGVITGYFTEPDSMDVHISCSNAKLDYKTTFSLIVEDESLISSFPNGILVNYIKEPLNIENKCSFPKYSLFSHPIHNKSIINEINIVPEDNEYIDDISFISTYDMNMRLEENTLVSFKLISINSVRMYINTFDHMFMEYEGCTYNKMKKSILLPKGNVFIHIDYVSSTNNNELLKLYYRIEGGDDNDEDSYQLLNNTIISTNLLSFMIKYPNNNNIILLNNTYINIKPIIIGLGYIKYYQMFPELPNDLHFNKDNGIIDGRVAEIKDLNCYTITGCNEVMCIETEVCFKIFAHSCYENEFFYSTLVNQRAYRQCENGYYGYKSEMCIINEVNYTGIPEWDETSWTEKCYLVRHEPFYSYETVVVVSFETSIDSYFFSDKFKGRINFFDLLDISHYFMNETSFIDTESNNNSVLTKVLFQFTCKEKDYYIIKEMIMSILNDVSFPNKYIGSTDDYILTDTIIFNPSFYHSIYKQLSIFLLIFFSILTVVSIIFILHLCKKANRLSPRRKNRYNIKYYIPYTDENNNNKNRKNSRRIQTTVNINKRKTIYI